MAKQKLSLKEMMALKATEINTALVDQKVNDLINTIKDEEISETSTIVEAEKIVVEKTSPKKAEKRTNILSDAEITSKFSQIKTTELNLKTIDIYNTLIKEKTRIDRTVNIDKELMKEIKTLKVQLDDKYTNNDIINVILYHGIGLLKK